MPAEAFERIFLHRNKCSARSPAGVTFGMGRVLRVDHHIPGGRLRAACMLICGVLAADGVPMRSAPSGPTEATTFPELVANTSTLAKISVTSTRS